MKKFIGLLLIVGLLFMLGCSAKKEDDSGEKKSNVKIMKIGSVVPKERSLAKGMYKFAEIVEKETNGAIKVEVYNDGVLGDDRRAIEGLQIGSIQGTNVSTGPIASFAPRLGIFDLPFLFKDKASAYKVLDGPIGQELLNDLPKVGLIGLAYWENGFRHLTNGKREVTTLEDIKGLKIRTMENKIHVDLWKMLNANPTPMSYNQLYSALEQRVVDGQENPLGNVKTAKFYEVQKYLTLTGHVYNANVFMVSKVFWDTLTDKEKEILKKAAEEAKVYQRQLNEQEDREYALYLSTQGMKVSELKPGEKEKIRAALNPLYEKYKPEFGEELVKRLMEAVK